MVKNVAEQYGRVVFNPAMSNYCFFDHLCEHKCSNTTGSNILALRTHKHPLLTPNYVKISLFFLGHPLKKIVKNFSKNQ